MARAFHAAVASLAAAASPLPSFKKTAGGGGSGTGGFANLQWLLRKRASKVRNDGRTPLPEGHEYCYYDDYNDDDGVSMFSGATPYYNADDAACRRKRGEALTRLRSAVLAVLARVRRGRTRGSSSSSRRPLGSSACVTGTIFGRRRGCVRVALQADPRAPPALVLVLAAYSTGALVKEMASGLVRLALECERAPPQADPAGGDHHRKMRQRRPPALVEEPTWRVYCNGRKCGHAVRRECGDEEWRVLRAVEPVSVGAGVIPEDDSGVAGAAGDGDMMYMRAKFERVVGSRDSEAFYMVNPDDGGGSAAGLELSIYLLRV